MKENEVEDDYEKSFAEFTGELAAEAALPEVEPEPAVEVEETAKEAAPEATGEPEGEEVAAEPVDPWAEAPEALRAEYQETVNKLSDLDHKHRSDIGRVSALQRQINELQAVQKTPPVEAAPETSDPLSLTDLDNDMPELARDVRSMIGAEVKRGLEQAGHQPSALEDDQLRPIIEDYQARQVEGQFAALEAAHPDFQAIANDQTYWDWVSAQPASIQAIASSDSAADVTAALTLYKSINVAAQPTPTPTPSPTSEKRTKQLAASVSIPSRRSNAAAPIADDDYDSAFDFYANQ